MKKYVLLLLIPLIPFLFSCGKKETNTQGNRFVNLAIGAPLRSLDPRIGNDTPTNQVISMLFEGLMCLGPKGEILPALAQSYDISEDKCTYTFHLRESYWSNGDPVTARHFEYAWKKAVNPKTAQNAASNFYCIKNVEACLCNEADIDAVGIRALDDKTFQVELEHPAPYFLSLCTRSTYAPIHPKFAEKNPYWGSDPGEDLVVNGPFCIKSWKKDVSLKIEKNPQFWNADSVTIPGINFSIIEDPITQSFLFEKGEIDWLGDPLCSLHRELIINGKYQNQYKSIDEYGLYWFFLNTAKPPFNNKNFRKAISYALDREALTKHIFQIGESPAMGILNAEIALQSAPYFEDKNLAAAQEHLNLALEEMGYTLETLPPIEISQRSSPFNSRVIQAIQDQLRKDLGVEVKVNHADWAVHFTNIQEGNYQMGEMIWHSWLCDPIDMLNTFRNKSDTANMSRWEHSHYQRLLNLADCETDIDKRNGYLQQAEKLLMEEMPIVPVCYTKYFFIQNPNLKGVYVSSLGEIRFRYAYFE